MNAVPVNYLAVVVAALANYVIGVIWYALLFRKAWRRLSGASEMKVSAVSVIVALVGAFLMSWVLAHAIVFAGSFMKVSGVGAGVEAAVFNWLGFIAPATIAVVIYEKKPFGFWLLNNAYWLVSLLVMGIILSVWT